MNECDDARVEELPPELVRPRAEVEAVVLVVPPWVQVGGAARRGAAR